MENDPLNGPSRWPWVRHPVTAALGVLALGLILTSALWFLLDRIDHQAAERQVDLAARQAALRLEDYVAGRLLALQLVVDQMADASDPGDEAPYRHASRRVQEHFTGFQAINWISADGRVRWLEPITGNEPAEGQLIYDHPGAGSFARRAWDSGRPASTSPVVLYQGGRGIAVYMPTITPEGELRGLVNGVFRIRDLIEDCFDDTLLHDYGLRLSDQGELVFRAEDFPESAQVVGFGEVGVLDRVWALELAPRSPVWKTLRHTNRLVLSLGFGVSLALAGLTFVLWRQREQRRLAAMERARMQSELQGARRLETIGRLAGGIAHDFNNLLTVVSAHAELARGHDPQADQHLDAVEAAGDRAAALTRQLLAFRGKQAPNPSLIALDQHLAELVGLLRRLVRGDVQVRFEPGADGFGVPLPPEQIAQILLNLVVNASDAMPDGGTVRIWTRIHQAEPRDPTDPRERSGRPSRWLELGVADDGEGIAASAQPYLFDPFFTTKEAGTGMGLATVASIVREAEGKIDFSSGPTGTSFRILLPGGEAVPAVEAPRSEPSGTLGPSARFRVLLVDDDPEVRHAVAQGLERAGLMVRTATDGADALHQVYAAGRPPDIVVSDQVMPVMGGERLAATLRRSYPTLPVILFSGYAETRPEVRRKLQAEGIDFLDKPIKLPELVQRCVTLVRRARARSELSEGVS